VPAQEAAKPVPEVAKPVPEVAKPVPEVAKPVPEVAKPVPEVVKPVTEVVYPVLEVLKPVPEAAKPVPEVVKQVPVARPNFPVAEQPEPACSFNKKPVEARYSGSVNADFNLTFTDPALWRGPVVEGWAPNVSRNVSLYLRPTENTILLEPRNLGFDTKWCQTTKLFIFQVCIGHWVTG
jgi:hypothetical protein